MGSLRKILVIPIFVVLITVLTVLPKDASATSPQIIFHDNYSSNVGWTQIGTEITVNSSQFPNMVKFNGESGGGGIFQQRVYKTLPSTLPSDRWVSEFEYKFTASQLVGAYIFSLTKITADPQIQPADGLLAIFHGLDTDKLIMTGSAGVSSSISISKNIQYYVRMEKSPTTLILSVFTDPARTIQVAGSPVLLTISQTDYNGVLRYIQHAGCLNCGDGRTLTAQITNTTIYQRPSSNGTFPADPPKGLTATPASPSQINLSWSAPSNDGGSVIIGYMIERSTNGGSSWSTLVSDTGSTSTAYSDTGLAQSTVYTYRVSAINSVGISQPSSTASAHLNLPSPPLSLSATPASQSQINLSWSAPSDNGGSAILGYMIERSPDGGTTWNTIVANTGNTATTYHDTGLASNTTFTYRVSAINIVGTSSPSNNASATTLNSGGTNYDIKDQPSCQSLTNSVWNSNTCMLINATLVLGNTDSLVVEPGITLALNKSSITSDGVIINNGAIQNRFLGILTNTGSLTNNGGAINNFGKIANAGNLNNKAGSSILNLGGNINNTGIISNGGVVQSNEKGVVITSGTLSNSGNLLSFGMMTNSGTMTNAGKFQSGYTNCGSKGRLVNTGTIINNNYFGYANSNSLLNSGNLTNNGYLFITCIIENQNGIITNFGEFHLAGNSYFVNAGTVTSSGLIGIAPYRTFSNALAGTLTNTGSIPYVGGVLANNGNLNNLGLVTASLTGSGSLTTNFTISDQSSCQLMSGSWDSGTSTCTINNITIGAGHSLQINAGVTLDLTGTLNNFGTFTNNGTIKNLGTTTNKSTGTLTNNGLVITSGALNNMNILNNNGSIHHCSGTIHNSGTINGNTIVNNTC